MKLAVAAVLTLTGAADAATIYMVSSGDPITDQAAFNALTSRGHSVAIGVQYPFFDGTQGLAGFDSVYLQSNANWGSGLMPATGQQALIDFVDTGGRLVTSEWVVYYSTPVTGPFGWLAPILPLEQSFAYGTLPGTTYAQSTPDPQINAGLPPSFGFPLHYYTGTETFTAAKPGAITYYTTANFPTGAGLAGWSIGQGQVFSFSSTCGPDQVGDANFGRLLANVMGAVNAGACYANCDNSTTAPILNVADFTCFLQAFAAGCP